MDFYLPHHAFTGQLTTEMTGKTVEEHVEQKRKSQIWMIHLITAM